LKALLAIAFIILAAVVIMFTARLLLKFMNLFENKVDISQNPYINYHKLKDKNDEHYDEYLKWLEKHGQGAPVDKIRTPEDIRAERKIKKLL